MAMRDLDWTHYEANDLLPEHYSCPFGIVIAMEGGRWESWLLTPAVRHVSSDEEIGLEKYLGNTAHLQWAKRSVALAITTLPPVVAMAARAGK